MRQNETALLVEHTLELVVRVDPGNHAVAETQGLRIDIGLNLVEQSFHPVGQALLRNGLLAQRIATEQLDRAARQIARSHRQTNRNALELVFGELEARAHVIARIDLDADSPLFQLGSQAFKLPGDPLQLLGSFIDRNHHDLDRSQLGRKHQAVVIGVRHNERAHQTGGNAPRSRPNVFELAFPAGELHVERLGEVLRKEMGGSALKRLAVLHQRLDRQRVLGSRETLAVALVTDDHRQAHPLFGELRIHADHFFRLGQRLLLGFVGRVPLLPQKFGRAQEKPRAHLPAHHVGPLVAQNRQIAV